jgi:hypothetical protein
MNLYLDVDGVLSPMAHRETGDFGDWVDEEFFVWSPEMVGRLGALEVTKFWLSTHLESANETLVPKFGWEPLGVCARRREFLWWKLEAIERVQPFAEPFVWIDDELDERRTKDGGIIEVMLRRYLAPVLLISPNSHTGISRAQLDEIEEFVERHLEGVGADI